MWRKGNVNTPIKLLVLHEERQDKDININLNWDNALSENGNEEIEESTLIANTEHNRLHHKNTINEEKSRTELKRQQVRRWRCVSRKIGRRNTKSNKKGGQRCQTHQRECKTTNHR